MKKNSYFGYHFYAGLLKFAGHFWFGGKVIGKENIPKSGGCVLAGNHVGSVDGYLLFSGTKRPIHFIGKKELFESKFAWFFKTMHIIKVDRNKKNPEAKKAAIDALKDGKIIGIFPEGTYHDNGSKTKRELLLPFKPGAINFSQTANVPIIPFAIIGKYKFRSNPKIVFGKPINMNEIDVEDKVKYLEEVIKDLLINTK